MRLLALLLAASLASPAAAAAGTPTSPARLAAPLKTTVVAVDCDRGKTIAEALEKTGDELVIEIRGTCTEELVIRRDRVALVGDGDDPTLIGSLIFEGASGVLLEGFTIRDSPRSGVRTRGADLVVRDLVVQDHDRAGIQILEGSTAILENVTSDRNFDGITTWASSSVELVGEVRTRGNRRCGMIVSSGSGLEATGVGALIGDRLIAEDNDFCGLAVQAASGAQFGEVIARRNGFIGVAAFAAYLGAKIEASGSFLGVWVSETANLEATVLARDNTFGIFAEANSTLVLSRRPGPEGNTFEDNDVGLLVDASHASLDLVDARGNGTGLSLDGSSARLHDVTLLDNGLDATLAFGSRVSFDGGNQVGSLTCEPSVLTRGEVSCPGPAEAAVPPGPAARSLLRSELSAFPLDLE